jgi:hypothetical protein
MRGSASLQRYFSSSYRASALQAGLFRRFFCRTVRMRDTNVLVRHFAQDDVAQSRKATASGITAAEAGAVALEALDARPTRLAKRDDGSRCATRRALAAEARF